MSVSKINYILQPSLKHSTLVKIATTLWSTKDLGTLIADYKLNNDILDDWLEIEEKVKQKVPSLPLPEILKENVLDLIKLVGFQILQCMKFFVKHDLCVVLPNNLCWTSMGLVDKKKTAEMLVKDESLDVTRRYVTACIFCLEEHILKLGNKIPKNHKRGFFSRNRTDGTSVELVIFWTYHINGKMAKMQKRIELMYCTEYCSYSVYQFAFKCAATNGCKDATEYFLQKLTPQEKEVSLVKTAGYVASKPSVVRNDSFFTEEYYADVLCFLLSQMTEEQQIEVFKNQPYKVLKCLLDWPWQDFFMDTAKYTWDFLFEDLYYLLLRIIVDKVLHGYKDCDYRNLFSDFWRQSPAALKRYVAVECARTGFLVSNLFEVEDKENIMLILKEATAYDKHDIIFNNEGKNICRNLISREKWDLLELFVHECISSRKVMNKFKDIFKNHIKCQKETDELNKFFHLMDNLVYEDDIKRSIEEGGDGPAKKLCTSRI